MKYFNIILIALMLVCLLNLRSYASTENVSNCFEEYVTNPQEYDKKQIVVEGIIDRLKFTTADDGKPYTLFNIIDGAENILNVYYQGKLLNVKKGSVVKVAGEFLKKKRYSFYSFKNVVKAKNVIVET